MVKNGENGKKKPLSHHLPENQIFSYCPHLCLHMGNPLTPSLLFLTKCYHWVLLQWYLHFCNDIYIFVWRDRQLLFIVNSAKVAFYNFIFIIKIPLDILGWPSIIRTQDLKSFGNSFSRFAARGMMVQHILIYIHTTRKVVNTV